MTLVKLHPAAHDNDVRPATSLIQHATIHDAANLSTFAISTFIDTYADYPDQTNLRLYANEAFAIERQTRELSDPGVTALLAYRQGRLCGFAQTRRHSSAAHASGSPTTELHRLYVDRSWHGLGVGQELLARVRSTAITRGDSALWLKVWERNARAIAFYRKCGFVDVGIADFFVREDRLTDRVMVLSLPAP